MSIIAKLSLATTTATAAAAAAAAAQKHMRLLHAEAKLVVKMQIRPKYRPVRIACRAPLVLRLIALNFDPICLLCCRACLAVFEQQRWRRVYRDMIWAK